MSSATLQHLPGRVQRAAGAVVSRHHGGENVLNAILNEDVEEDEGGMEVASPETDLVLEADEGGPGDNASGLAVVDAEEAGALGGLAVGQKPMR
ncbi:Adenylyl-sulfate kinase [Psidium guajava]|nr:Adenylyl-sulfate kinase [Psidium guajava]